MSMTRGYISKVMTGAVDWFPHTQPFFTPYHPYLLLSMFHRGPTDSNLADLLMQRLGDKGITGNKPEMWERNTYVADTLSHKCTRYSTLSTWLLNCMTASGKDSPWLLVVLHSDSETCVCVSLGMMGSVWGGRKWTDEEVHGHMQCYLSLHWRKDEWRGEWWGKKDGETPGICISSPQGSVGPPETGSERKKWKERKAWRHGHSN